jgi:protein gp37/ParB-like chromosome segregation protein Spo0J
MSDALKQHPLSAAFPSMSDAAFGELRADIAANGLRHPIVLYDGAVLDGWHRYRACTETGIPIKSTEFKGDADKARKFVVSANLMRRHLDTSERALIAARFATLAHGSNRYDGRGTKSSLLIEEAAKLFNVGTSAVKDARAVLTEGSPETIAAVEAGEMSVSRAAKETRASTPKPAKPPKPAAPAEFEIVPRTISEWNALSITEQKAYLSHRNPGAKLNRQDDAEDGNLIDWARYTWNPITGCLHNCPYCYARDISERFAGTTAFPNGFTPTLRADRLSAPLNGTPRASEDPRERRIFTGSMTDLFGRWVPPEWINAVLDVTRRAQQWEFLMLTKFPKRMAEFEIPDNVWMGTTVDCQARVAAAESAFANVKAKVRWLSCEPLIEPLRFKHLDRFDLLVIGGASPSAETPRWIPPYNWLHDLQSQADEAGCAVFMKSNLYRKEEPGGSRYRFADRAPDVFHYLARASSPDQEANAA